MLHELVLEQKGEHRHSQLRLLLHLPYAFSRHRDAPDNSGEKKWRNKAEIAYKTVSRENRKCIPLSDLDSRIPTLFLN